MPAFYKKKKKIKKKMDTCKQLKRKHFSRTRRKKFANFQVNNLFQATNGQLDSDYTRKQWKISKYLVLRSSNCFCVAQFLVVVFFKRSVIKTFVCFENDHSVSDHSKTKYEQPWDKGGWQKKQPSSNFCISSQPLDNVTWNARQGWPGIQLWL